MKEKRKRFQGKLEELHKNAQKEWKSGYSKSEEMLASFLALKEGEK